VPWVISREVPGCGGSGCVEDRRQGPGGTGEHVAMIDFTKKYGLYLRYTVEGDMESCNPDHPRGIIVGMRADNRRRPGRKEGDVGIERTGDRG
jgi:hypothetical protein